ncbi:hypothetical protein GN956_G2918 [Arapaima gigas]
MWWSAARGRRLLGGAARSSADLTAEDTAEHRKASIQHTGIYSGTRANLQSKSGCRTKQTENRANAVASRCST